MATMGFAAAGLVSLVAAIGIVAGATVGTTSTSWLVALTGVGRAWFPWFMPMLLVGALLRFLGRGRVSYAGGFMAGFGLLLAGLNLLRPVMAPLVTSLGLMDASGSGLVQAYCTACHSLAPIVRHSGFTAEQWASEVQKMREVYGAPIDDPTAKQITAYLQKHYTVPVGELAGTSKPTWSEPTSAQGSGN